MPFEEKIEKALAQATNYYLAAWKEKPSLEDALRNHFSRSYPRKPSSFDVNCSKGMKKMLSLCGDKFSCKHICGRLPVFYNLIDTTVDLSRQQISDMLHNIYQEYIEWNEETTVYFPVECIKVNGDEGVALGSVSFWNFNVLLEKNKRSAMLNQLLANQPKSGIPETVAAFSMIADLQKTHDVGKQIVNDVLNVIQFITPMPFVHKETPHFLLSEVAIRQHAATFTKRGDTLSVDSMYRTGSVLELSLPLIGDAKKMWDQAFGNDAIAIMQSQSNGALTEALRHAIYWHATGERENSRERAFIYYTMALEAILTQSGSQVSAQTAIAESIAIILGKSLKERLEFKKKAKELYRLRSQIAHGKMSPVNPFDLEVQRYFSYSTIKFVFSKRNEFHRQEDIAQYIENLKFTLPEPIVSAHVSNGEEKDA